MAKDRSSHPEMFYKKVFLRNFEKSIEKHLCLRPYFNKFMG